MGEATVQAHRNGAESVTLEIFAGDKHRGKITLPIKGKTKIYLDEWSHETVRSVPDGYEFLGWLRDAALEAAKMENLTV